MQSGRSHIVLHPASVSQSFTVGPTAVRYESDGAAGRETADLVVDAMGRASRLSAWLDAAGRNVRR